MVHNYKSEAHTMRENIKPAMKKLTQTLSKIDVINESE